MLSQGPIFYVCSNPKFGMVTHNLSLALTFFCITFLSYDLVHIFAHYDITLDAMLYIFLLFFTVILYWPGAIYRFLICLLSLINLKKYYSRVDRHSSSNHLPISVIIPIRNEPSEMVINLLENLKSFRYLGLEIVLTDNSDILNTSGTENHDFFRILEYIIINKDSIRFIRRANKSSSEICICGLDNLYYSNLFGDLTSGKSENLNEAMRQSSIRFRWFLILDADSYISEDSFSSLICLASSLIDKGEQVGFIQSVPKSSFRLKTMVSRTIGYLENIYYDEYFPAKALVGNVSNWGHNVLISRDAWESTGGFPNELCEDLAWANQLAIDGIYHGYYALVDSIEDKPVDWRALQIQRGRWATGTTKLLVAQAGYIFRSDRIPYFKKLDLIYDLTSYLITSLGCFIPFLFLAVGLLLEVYSNLLYVFFPYFVLIFISDNLFIPIQLIKRMIQLRFHEARTLLYNMIFISIFSSALAPNNLKSIFRLIFNRNIIFEITPKHPLKQTNFSNFLTDNIWALLFGLVNFFIAFHAVQLSFGIGVILFLSPISYVLAPCIGRSK